MRRSILLVLLAVAACALLAWWANDRRVPSGAASTAPSAAATTTLAQPDAAKAPAAATAATIPTEPAAERIALPGADAPPVLWGIVRSPNGAPIAGAHVVATANDLGGLQVFDANARASMHVLAQANSGADGRYELRLADSVRGLLTVSAAGCATAHRAGVGAGMQVDFVLQPSVALRGRVVRARDGAPVAACVVHVRQAAREGDPGGAALASATTAADGTFAVGALAPGLVRVQLQPAAELVAREEDVEVPAAVTAGNGPAREFRLADGAVVRGRVFDAATQRPLGGATVHDGFGKSVLSAADGTFTFAGFGGTLLLRARAPGYGELEVMVARFGAPVLTEVAFGLMAAAKVHGRIVDANGAPAANVYVAVAGSDYHGPGDLQRIAWAAARTGPDGAFALADLRSDLPQSLLLQRAGAATLVFDLGQLAPGEDRDLGDLALRAGGSVHGRVHDERGAPVARHRVTLRGSNGDRRARATGGESDGIQAIDVYVASREQWTTDDGVFAFADVAPGAYSIACAKFDSHGEQQQDCEVAAGGAQTAVDVELVRGVELRGRVTVSDGGALPKVYASIDPEDGQRTDADVELGADGTFVARGLLDGNYKVSLYPYATASDKDAQRSFRPWFVEHVRAGGGEVAIELIVMLPVRVQIIDAAGAPLRDVRVLTFDGRELLGDGGTDGDGRVVLSGPARRSVHVSVRRPAAGQAAGDAPELTAADVLPGSAEVLLRAPSR